MAGKHSEGLAVSDELVDVCIEILGPRSPITVKQQWAVAGMRLVEAMETDDSAVSPRAHCHTNARTHCTLCPACTHPRATWPPMPRRSWRGCVFQTAARLVCVRQHALPLC